jgi:hypothetical protein
MIQLLIRHGRNLVVAETEIYRQNKGKCQLEYKIVQIDQRKDLVEFKVFYCVY